MAIIGIFCLGMLFYAVYDSLGCSSQPVWRILYCGLLPYLAMPESGFVGMLMGAVQRAIVFALILSILAASPSIQRMDRARPQTVSDG